METIKVFGHPTPETARRNASNGISQVVLNVARHLPEFGYELVENRGAADIIAHHAGSGDYSYTDVAHCHGLYPTGEPQYTHENIHEGINDRVIHDILTAQQVTVPSEWVAQILRNEFHIDPVIIPWAVDRDKFKPGLKSGNYVLWNKNRVEGVCQPDAVNYLAEHAEDIQFISTFGNDSLPNLRTTGLIPHDDMVKYVRRAGLYLATTRETGDIGSREALAAGVPVLGFRQGALPDFVHHGVNGFLVEPGDMDGLLSGLRWCFAHRATLSKNALYFSRDWTWRRVAGCFADVYRAVKHDMATISVIIPCYNYADRVGDAIKSVVGQETAFDFELIVVNDGSTDDSLNVIEDLQAEYNFRVISTENKGVAHARNTGIEAAKGDLIACLDADDRMAQGFLDICARTLLNNPSMGIAYTGLLAVFGEEHRQSQWPGPFDLEGQLRGRNQVPSLCMFRKIAWQRAGGYRQRYHPSEDARLWLDIVELGYKAIQATSRPLFLYSIHNDSASKFPDGSYKPVPQWRDNKGYRVNDAARPAGIGGRIINYDPPLVSVIIPVGPGHEHILQEALDSVHRQTERNIEVIVINDTGDSLDVPVWTRLYSTGGQQGAGAARNVGLDVAEGSFVLFLDADDLLLPQFIEATLDEFKVSGRYIYTDYLMVNGNEQKYSDVPQFEAKRIFEHGMYHAITCLIPRWCIGDTRFEEDMPSWEDLDFFMQLNGNGVCGRALKKALFVYRIHTGSLRERARQHEQRLKEHLFQKKFKEYREGDIMCKCGGNATQAGVPEGADMIRVVYQPENRRGLPVKGQFNFSGRPIKGYGRMIYRNIESGSRLYVYRHDYEANKDVFIPAGDFEAQKDETQIPGKPVELK